VKSGYSVEKLERKRIKKEGRARQKKARRKSISLNNREEKRKKGDVF